MEGEWKNAWREAVWPTLTHFSGLENHRKLSYYMETPGRGLNPRLPGIRDRNTILGRWKERFRENGTNIKRKIICGSK
jgi:hypothetical protein